MSPSFNLVGRIRSRRLRWLGKMLAANDDYIVKKAVIAWAMDKEEYPDGSIMMDAPRHDTMKELIDLAQNKEEWRLGVNVVKCYI